jgi:tetratricopeptide (TPR) repeat protein
MAAQKHEIDELVAHLRQANAPSLLVTGTRGSGKTTLMEGLRHALDAAGLPVVFHSTELNFDSCETSTIVDRISKLGTSLLNQRGIRHRRVPQLTPYANEPALTRFEFKGEILYILIDGLDFVADDNGFDTSFFPIDLPPCMRLVLSVSHGPRLDALAARRFLVHEMAPLPDLCKSEILLPRLEEVQNRNEVMQKLLAWPLGGHPTHLLFAARLAQLTGAAPEPSDDLLTVLNRLVDSMGPVVSQLAAFASCRFGFPSRGIIDLARLSPAEPIIVRRSNFYQPATPEVQQVLRQRFNEAELRSGRIELAEQLAKCHAGAVVDEAAQHLYDLDEKVKLADMLTTLQVFAKLIHRSSGTFGRYWRQTGATDTLERFERMFESHAAEFDPRSRAAQLSNIGLLLSECGILDVSERFYRRAIETARTSTVPQPGNLAVSMHNLALLVAKKPERYAEADQIYLELLAMVDSITEDIPLKKWKLLDYYADHLEKMIRNEEAVARREQAIAAARKELGDGHTKVGELLLNLSSNIRWWKPEQALACAKQGHAIMEAAAGPHSSQALWGLRTIAQALQMLGQYQEARAIYEKTLEIGKAEAGSSPYGVSSALENLAESADEAGDRQLGLRFREAKLEHLQTQMGPQHTDTIRSTYSLAMCYERNGQRDRALALMEEHMRHFSGLGKGESYNQVNGRLQVARLRLSSGDRQGCAVLVDEIECIPTGEFPSSLQTEFLLLKCELASATGAIHESRRLVEEACRLHPMNHEDLQSQSSLVRVVQAGLFHLAGDTDASLRQHEAGVQHLRFAQRHMLEFALRPYERSLRDHIGPEDLARARMAEMRLMLDTHIDSFGLALFVLPPCPIRAAWNPRSASILALLDSQGTSYLFNWHASANMLEQLPSPLAPVEMPADPGQVSFNWSLSGEALRLRTPKGQQVTGHASPDETWAPASAISPEGAYVAVMRRQSVRIARTVACVS